MIGLRLLPLGCSSLERLWEFLDERHPQLGSSAQVRREHLLAWGTHVTVA